MRLGEAQSKCEQIAGVPLLPATAEFLHRLYLAKGALATTAIEGNTLTEAQVLQHLEGGLSLPASQQYLQREIDNVVSACNRMLEGLLAGTTTPLTPQMLKHWNAAVLDGLELAPEVRSGEIRTHSVVAGRYRGAPAEDCDYLLEGLCSWLNEFPSALFETRGAESVVAAALLKAILGHLYLVWIHPFGDGNGRTARLLEFHLLVAAGLPSPAAHLLSNHYNETRAEYHRQLDAASRAGVSAFLEYALVGFVSGLCGQIARIRDQQWEISWEHFVHERFADRTSPADLRQRDLLLDLATRRDPVPVSELSMLTPRIAAAYARRTAKTLTRDVNALIETGLVERSAAGLRARRELVLAFLPRRRPGPPDKSA